jgi:hypothetical protein
MDVVGRGLRFWQGCLAQCYLVHFSQQNMGFVRAGTELDFPRDPQHPFWHHGPQQSPAEWMEGVRLQVLVCEPASFFSLSLKS